MAAAVRRMTEAQFEALVAEMRERAGLPPKPKPLAPKSHLTETQLAERWGLSREAVRRMRYRGEGPAHLLIRGSRTQQVIRYRLKEIEDFEKRQLQASA